MTNRKKLYRRGCAALAIITMISSVVACTSGGDPNQNQNDLDPIFRSEVADCGEYNNNEVACEKASQNGVKCEYDETTKVCKLKVMLPPNHCSKMSVDKEKCEEDKNCTWDGTDSQCKDADASITGKCAAIQAQKFCDNDEMGCTWDDSLAPYKCKSGVSYLELSFTGEIAALHGTKDTQKDISAIGQNGDGSLVYFGERNPENNSLIFYFPPNDLVNDAKSFPTQPKGADDSTGGKAKLGMINSDMQVTSIVAGPGNQALASIYRINKNPLEAGVLEIENDQVRGAWRSMDNELSTGADNKYITNINVMAKKWLAFVAENASTGAHFPFSAKNLKKAFAGPKTSVGNLGVQILASAVRGDDLYLAYKHANGPIVVKNSISKKGGSYELDKEIDIGEDKSLIARNQMSTGSGNTPNDTITAMDMVVDDLLIGFNDDGEGSGGVAIYNVKTKVITSPTHNRWHVKHIGVSKDRKSAIISTTKGLLFYINGKLVKLEHKTSDAALLTEAKVTANKPLVINGGNLPSLDQVTIGAVNTNDMWFIATSTGIYKADVTLKAKN